MSDKKPILVTGAHRSGTTWVGKMLADSADITYISEPLNVWHRPGVFKSPTQYWYTYICEDNQADFLPAFQETLRFQYHLGLEIQSLRSLKDFGRMLRDWGWFLRGRIQATRTLLKDPFAVFSAPWFAKELNCQVVLLVRHPLAFVSSLKRLGWDFDVRDLLAQPLLMRDYLEPFRAEMNKVIAEPTDIIEQGCLLWRMVYTVVDSFQSRFPEFVVVRHEDLSRQPLDEFRQLYATLDLAFTPKVQQTILDSSQGNNPTELSANQVHAVNLDSQVNLFNWKKRLTDEEVNRIQELTAEVAANFYPKEIWESK